MEEYTAKNGIIHILDPEMGLSIETPFIDDDLPVELPDSSSSNIRISRDSNGVLYEAFLEKDGKKHGQWVLYYPSGKLKMSSYYENGVLHGPSVFYSEKGILLAKSYFIHGEREGKCYWYYPNGHLYSVQRFQSGSWEGKQEYLHPNGALKTLLQYSAGKLEGTPQLYDSAGNPQSTR